MKKVYTFILSLLVGAAVMAADSRPRSGMINISVKQITAVRVVVDGRSYNDNTVSLSNLAPGTHSVQVYSASSSRGALGSIFGRNREQLLWSSSVYVKSGTETDVIINKKGKAKVKEVNMPYSAAYGNGSWGNANDGNDRRYDHNDRGYDRNDHSGNHNDRGYGSNGSTQRRF